MFQQLLDVCEVDKSDPKLSCEKLMQKYIEVSIVYIRLSLLFKMYSMKWREKGISLSIK